jgi:hypothetical protein
MLFRMPHAETHFAIIAMVACIDKPLVRGVSPAELGSGDHESHMRIDGLNGVSRYVPTNKTQTSVRKKCSSSNSFPHLNGCESSGVLLERKDETASPWPFRPNRFGNWLGLHEYWDC